jgi:hypothetical protein
MTKFPNANMFQKSIIPQQLEYNAMVEKFKQCLANLVESYNVNGNVFGWQGKPVEFETGYFVVESEKDNLQDAIREMSSLDKCIRIVENKIFQVGTVVHYISECAPDAKVLDIENQIFVER